MRPSSAPLSRRAAVTRWLADPRSRTGCALLSRRNVPRRQSGLMPRELGRPRKVRDGFIVGHGASSSVLAGLPLHGRSMLSGGRRHNTSSRAGSARAPRPSAMSPEGKPAAPAKSAAPQQGPHQARPVSMRPECSHAPATSTRHRRRYEPPAPQSQVVDLLESALQASLPPSPSEAPPEERPTAVAVEADENKPPPSSSSADKERTRAVPQARHRRRSLPGLLPCARRNLQRL